MKIGDPQPKVVDDLNLLHGGSIENPWANGSAPPDYLSRILTPERMMLTPEEMQRLEVRRSKDEKVCVVFVDAKVRGLAVRQPNTVLAEHRVGVSSSESAVLAAFGVDFHQDVLPAAHTGARRTPLVRVYRTAGVGFEIQNGVVTGVALFPAAPAGQ